MGDDQRPAQVLLEERPEHEPQEQRRRLAAELDEEVAQEPEERDRETSKAFRSSEYVPMQANATIAGKSTRYGTVSILTQMPISGRLSSTSIRLPTHIETTRPQKSAGSSSITFGPGRDPLDDERADHQRHDGMRRQAQRQQRDERGLRGGVVGGLRAGDALDRPMAERLRALRDRFSTVYERERREDVAGARQDPQRGPERRAAEDGRDDPAKVLARQHRFLTRLTTTLARRSSSRFRRISATPNMPTATDTKLIPGTARGSRT